MRTGIMVDGVVGLLFLFLTAQLSCSAWKRRSGENLASVFPEAGRARHSALMAPKIAAFSCGGRLSAGGQKILMLKTTTIVIAVTSPEQCRL